MSDLISRQAAIDVLEKVAELYPYRVPGDRDSYSQYNEAWQDALNRADSEIEALPSAQPERLTDDDFETIRIHLNAYKEKLCNQQRWEEADEYQRIIDRFMAFASAEPDVPDTNVGDTIYRQDAIDALAKKMPSWTTPDGSGEFDHDIQITDEAFVDCMQIINELPSAQPEQRWIPCSERMPEYDKPVLLSTAWCKTEIGFWTQRGWMIVACSYREFEQSAVTAWMPLPEPYRRGGENE